MVDRQAWLQGSHHDVRSYCLHREVMEVFSTTLIAGWLGRRIPDTWVVANGRRVLNMVSHNFLGLAGDPVIKVHPASCSMLSRLILFSSCCF